MIDANNKYPCNVDSESDVYDYSVMPERKSTTCSVLTGKTKIQIESNETTLSLSILLSTITMSYCALKLRNF